MTTPAILCPVCARRRGGIISTGCPACNGLGRLHLGRLATTEDPVAVAIAVYMGFGADVVDDLHDHDSLRAVHAELTAAGFIAPEPAAQPLRIVTDDGGPIATGTTLHQFRQRPDQRPPRP